MRKQPPFLKHIADTALIDRNVNSMRAVEQALAVNLDVAGVGAHEPGNRIDERGLAGSRASEQCGDAGIAREFGVEREAADRLRSLYAKHHGLARAAACAARAIPTVS